jgi:hypothetical protein
MHFSLTFINEPLHGILSPALAARPRMGIMARGRCGHVS